MSQGGTPTKGRDGVANNDAQGDDGTRATATAIGTKGTTKMTRRARKDRIRRLEADRRALVKAAIESGADDAEARMIAAMEILIGCGAETIGIAIDTDPFEDRNVERIEVTGHHARWREWWAEGESGRCRLVLDDARGAPAIETDGDGRTRKTRTEEGTWTATHEREGHACGPALDLGGPIGRSACALVGGACRARITIDEGPVRGRQWRLDLDAARRDEGDTLRAGVEESVGYAHTDGAAGARHVRVSWSESQQPGTSRETAQTAEQIARRSPVATSVNNVRIHRSAVPPNTRHAHAVAYDGGTVWAFAVQRERADRGVATVHEGVRARADVALPELVEDVRRVPLPDGTTMVGRRVARCIAVRSGRTDEVGERHAATEALAEVARTLATRGEAMLLDRTSLGIAHAGGATEVARHRTLAVHELLRGRRAVTIANDETGAEEGPGTSLPGVRDGDGTLYVGVGEHADATTLCTMLSVQQASRRRGQEMVLYERTDAFSQYEATANVPFVTRAGAIAGNDGGVLDAEEIAARDDHVKGVIRLRKGRRLIAEVEVRQGVGRGEESTREVTKIDVDEVVMESRTADAGVVVITGGRARSEDAEEAGASGKFKSSLDLLRDCRAFLYPEEGALEAIAEDAMRGLAERVHGDERSERRAQIEWVLQHGRTQGTERTEGAALLLEGEKMTARRDAESGQVTVEITDGK